MRWDIFCQVIDNHGDAGVCWRLAAELARRGDLVRLWIDDARALAGMAPGGQAGVEVRPWADAEAAQQPGDAVVEAFGCDPPAAFVAAMASATDRRRIAWINLEYLSAESYVRRSHALPSPVASGPGKGLTKHFFYPGFERGTGGLIREQDLLARQAAFDRAAWLAANGIPGDQGRCISLFCYEPAALTSLLLQMAAADVTTQLLVTAGRAAAATRTAIDALNERAPGWNGSGRLAVHFLPFLAQREYDHLLWSCALNFVRGEDSVVRAVLAGRPFVWNIYPQEDGAHAAKLAALLDWMKAPASLRAAHICWNGLGAVDLPALEPGAWEETARLARERAFALPELAAELASFAMERGTI